MTLFVLSVLFSVVAPLAAVASPFAPNATVSVDDVLPVQNLVVPTGLSRQGELIGGGPNGTTSGVNCGDDRPRVLIDCTDEGPEICPVPAEGSIPDWTSLFVVDYGIQVDNRWKQYTFGGQTATHDDVLRHLRDTMATVHAVFKRDAGVVMRLKHVRIMDAITSPSDDDLADQASWAFWKANLPPVEFT